MKQFLLPLTLEDFNFEYNCVFVYIQKLKAKIRESITLIFLIKKLYVCSYSNLKDSEHHWCNKSISSFKAY